MGACLHTSPPVFDAPIASPTAAPIARANRRSRPSGYDLLSGVFAVILLVAAALKAHALYSTFNLESHWKQLAGTMPILLEWLLAIWLLSGFAKKWARRVSLTALSVFLLVAGTRWLRGYDDCGCFGRVSVHPALMATIDALALAAIYWCGKGSLAESRVTSSRVALAICLSLVIPTVTLALIQREATGQIVVLDPLGWKGKVFPLLNSMQPSAHELAHGQWTIFVVNRNCQTCREYVARTAFQTGNVALLDIGAESKDHLNEFRVPVPVFGVRADTVYFLEGPFVVVLREGLVTEVNQAK
jgi:hypothetical protein